MTQAYSKLDDDGMVGIFMWGTMIFVDTFVIVDGEEVNSVNHQNKILTIPYTANTEKIEVYGSYVIPEFGTIAMIVLAVAVVSIIVLSRKNSISYSLSNV